MLQDQPLRQASSLSHLVNQIVRYAPSSLVPAVIGVASTSLFTRLLSSVEYGRYSLVVSLSIFVSAIGTQWLNQSLARYLPGEHRAEVKTQLKQSVAVSLFTLSCLVAGSVAVLLFAHNVAFLTEQTAWIGISSLILGLLTGFWAPLNGVFQAEMRAGAYTRYNLIQVTARFLLSAVFVSTVMKNANGMVIASMLSMVFCLPSAWRAAGIGSWWNSVARWQTLLPTVRRLAGYGFPMMGWALVANLLDVSDRYVINYYRDASEVGMYSAGYSLVAGIGALCAAPILLAAQPFLMQAWGKGDRETAAAWLGKIFDWFTLLGVCAIGLMWLLSADIAGLVLGAQFRESHTIMPIVLAGVFVWQLSMYLHKPLEFVGRTRLMLAIATGAVLANAVLNLLLVPLYGYVAAAYTTLFSYVLYAMVSGAHGKRILDWPVRWSRLGTVVLLCVVSVAAASIARTHLQPAIGYIGSLLLSVAIALVGPVSCAVYQWRSDTARTELKPSERSS